MYGRSPSRLSPMLATLVDAPFDSPDHLFEVKWDDMRAIALIDNGRVTLRTRRGHDVTATFPEFQSLADQVNQSRAVLDGEIVSFGHDGKPSFERLQQRNWNSQRR